MDARLIEFLSGGVALLTGGTIGYAFGLLQDVARHRHEERERSGRLKSGWSLMPGSGARVAYFLVALALVQLFCPLLFKDGMQWVVSVGVLLGYGSVLFRSLRRRLASGR